PRGRADARVEAARGRRESRPPAVLARAQPVARAGIRLRASPRPTGGAPVRCLPAPRRPAMMRAPAWRGREAILAAAVFTTLVAVAAVWLALDRRPPEWDHANHLERAVTCAGDLARGDLRAVLARSSFYPPLVLCAHRGWSVVAGLALGLGMLTKPPFAAYVLAPLVLTAARIRSRRAVANLALAFLIGGALSLPWYGPRLLGLLPEVASRGFRQAAESGHPDPLTATALTLYPRWFPTQFGLVAVVLFVLGLGVAAWRRHWLLLAAVVSHAETPRSRAFATSRSESTTSASTRSARPRKAGSIRSTPNECESSGRRSSPPT